MNFIKRIEENEKGPLTEVTFNYMIGDADGDDTETVEFVKDITTDPEICRQLEAFVNLCNNTRWSVRLTDDEIDDIYKKDDISFEDYCIILANIGYESFSIEDGKFEFDDYGPDAFNDPKVQEGIMKYCPDPIFSECIRTESDLGGYYLEDVDITYYDENGVKYDVLPE